MKQYLSEIVEGRDLSQSAMGEAFDLIMSGEATPAQIGAFIASLRVKGETAEEIAGAASSMRRHAVFIDAAGAPVIDTCGTGGDKCDTFNVSTTAAFVAAGAGVPVAKHGNRAISSKCGSADLLAELGVNIEADQATVEECVQETGIGFLYAPRLHPAMKYAMTPRRELGIRTIFNMLGPLTNPAGARSQIIGVFSPDLTEPFAEVLKLLGSRKAFVVHGHDGMDEITTTTTTRISELRDGRIRTYDFDPVNLIGDYSGSDDLRGGEASVNAGISRGVLSGEKGPARDIVCLNAAAAISAGGKCDDISEGWKLAQESVDSGSAERKLEELIKATAS
ncbi:MAG: anthranilate phosphoribosyltransferase [Kiritimatiellia bacterium]